MSTTTLTDRAVLAAAHDVALEHDLVLDHGALVTYHGHWTMDDFALAVCARLAYSEEQERDESGKFGQGGGGSKTAEKESTPSPVAPRAAGSFGVVEDKPPPESSGWVRWGETQMSNEELDAARQESIDALDQAGYNGAAVADAVTAWSYGAGIENDFRAVANGAEPHFRSESVNVGATQLGDLIRSTTTSGDLYRGVVLSREQADALQPGASVSGDLTSWSRNGDVADAFALDTIPGATGDVPVVMHVADDVHGLDSPTLVGREFSWQDEVIVGNEMTVSSVSPEPRDLGGGISAIVVEMAPA